MGTYAISGTASGIGAATKARLESDGHRVIGVDLRDAYVTADLATADGRSAAVDAVCEASGGRLDGLITCAGVGGTVDAELTVRLNYFGTTALVHGLRPALAAADGQATVVLVSSNSTTMTPGLSTADADVYLAGDEEAAVAHFTSGSSGATGASGQSWTAYPAGKLAIAFWTRAYAPLWLTDGIRVNAVAPGVIRTAMTEQVEAQEALKSALDQIPIPANRWGRPEEIAEVITFLASPASSYIVGQVIFADGGTDAVLQPRAHPHPLPAS